MHLIEKYFFKERRDALRIRFLRLVLKHRTSYPYLSGDAFAELCDYAAFGKDGTRDLNLRRLRQAKKLFVPGHKLSELLSNHYGDISATVLICGNSDQNFIEDPLLPKSIKLWLCQNYAVEDGFGKVLPIGLENLRLGKSGFTRFFQFTERKRETNKILVPPMRITNAVRNEVINLGKRIPSRFTVVEEYMSSSEYFDLLTRHKYVLVMEGNGFDTHRLWECLYLNCTPIVLRSSWSVKLVEELELPILIIPDIKSLEGFQVDESITNRSLLFYKTYKDYLYIPAWKNYIHAIAGE